MQRLEVRALEKRFPRQLELRKLLRHPLHRESVEALSGIDLVLEAGRVYGLVGPNGAGKTTLLKLLGGLVLPTSGSILLDGKEHAGHPALLRQRIRMVVADERSFFWRLSVRENLRFFATLEGRSGKERDRLVERCLDEVSLADRARDPFRDLSTGLRQRLAIARGLLGEPEILLLDEATRSLDPGSAAEVCALLRGLCAASVGRTLVWSSHDLSEVEDLCTDVIALGSGAVRLQRPIEPAASARLWRLRTRTPPPPEVWTAVPGLAVHATDTDEVLIEVPSQQALDALLEHVRASGAGLVLLAPTRLDPRELFASEPEPST